MAVAAQCGEGGSGSQEEEGGVRGKFGFAMCVHGVTFLDKGHCWQSAVDAHLRCCAQREAELFVGGTEPAACDFAWVVAFFVLSWRGFTEMRGMWILAVGEIAAPGKGGGRGGGGLCRPCLLGGVAKLQATNPRWTITVCPATSILMTAGSTRMALESAGGTAWLARNAAEEGLCGLRRGWPCG